MASTTEHNLVVTPEEIESFLTELYSITITVDEINSLLKVFGYQGFDPSYTANRMRKLAGNARDWRKDVEYMAGVFAVGGTNLNKIRSKICIEEARKINDIVSFYKMKNGTPNSKADITLGRVAVIGAHIVSHYFDREIAKPVVSEMPNGYPKAMFSPVFASLIPKSLTDEESKILTQAYLWHQHLFDVRINSRTKRYANANKLIQLVNIQVASTLYPDSIRNNLAKKWGILEQNTDKLTETTKAACMIASAKWQELNK